MSIDPDRRKGRNGSGMSRYHRADLSAVQRHPISARHSLVDHSAWGEPFEPGEEFEQFLDSLPDVLAVSGLKRLAGQVVAAHRKGRGVILMMGGHVMKVGLIPVVADLIERGIVTTVAMNSAAAIHDVESGLFGATSEDVAAALDDGSFGMAEETGQFINSALLKTFRSSEDDRGFGEVIGDELLSSPLKYPSILATSARMACPATVHVAIGADIIHQHPDMNGSATGELTFRDFQLLASQISTLDDGGVVLNIGSSVILPEVFLKGLTVARNLGFQVDNFTAANFDMIRHYRPRMNVLERPTRRGGEWIDIAGHHEVMIPLFAAMIKREWKRRDGGDENEAARKST